MDSAGVTRCLRHLSDALSIAVQRPLILVYNGCSSYFNGEIVHEAVRLKTSLCSSQQTQITSCSPEDVSVLKPFKASIDAVMRGYNLNGGEGSIMRKNSHSLGEHRVEQGHRGQAFQCDCWLQSVRTSASITVSTAALVQAVSR